MGNLLIFLLCFVFIVFLVYLFLKQIQFALEVTSIYKNWLTPKIILNGP